MQWYKGTTRTRNVLARAWISLIPGCWFDGLGLATTAGRSRGARAAGSQTILECGADALTAEKHRSGCRFIVGTAFGAS